MLERLLETGAQRQKSAWGGAVSVIVHGTIIALVLAATAHANPIPDLGHDFVPIIPLQPPADNGPTQRPGRGAAGSAGDPTTLPSIPPIEVPTTLDAPIPGTVPVSAGAGADTGLLSEIGASGNGPGATFGGSGVASDARVDVPVRALGDRAPAYPEMLRTAGITGVVRVQFVVDTTGRAEPSSIRVLESTHALFTQSVLASLRNARFTPGEVSGHRVRTLVERSFRFDIAGGAR